MSVLIKGMEMPKQEEKIVVFPNGSVFVEDEDNYNLACLRRTSIKANQLPPHGRLIDADALDKCYYFDEQEKYDSYVVPIGVIRQNIKDAHTIVPAEGVAENG